MRSFRLDPPLLVSPAVKAATLLIAVALPLVASADRVMTAPRGIDLTGVWSIDRKRSDDPTKTQEFNRKEAKYAFHVRVGGGLGGLGGFGGLSGVGNPGHGPPATSASREPTQQHEHSIAVSERIEILQLPESVDLKLADYYISCTSTAKTEVSLPERGSAERTCGWEGDAFVVEIHDAEGFSRSDRYAVDDAKSLIVETTVTSDRLPKLSFKSVYGRSELD